MIFLAVMSVTASSVVSVGMKRRQRKAAVRVPRSLYIFRQQLISDSLYRASSPQQSREASHPSARMDGRGPLDSSLSRRGTSSPLPRDASDKKSDVFRNRRLRKTGLPLTADLKVSTVAAWAPAPVCADSLPDCAPRIPSAGTARRRPISGGNPLSRNCHCFGSVGLWPVRFPTQIFGLSTFFAGRLMPRNALGARRRRFLFNHGRSLSPCAVLVCLPIPRPLGTCVASRASAEGNVAYFFTPSTFVLLFCLSISTATKTGILTFYLNRLGSLGV